MTSFVHVERPTDHPGVARAERVAQSVKQAAHNFDGGRGTAAFLLAAIVSALLVAANQVVDTWTEGHLLAAWIVMWAVGFAALALLAVPARNASVGIRKQLQAWAVERRQNAADEQLWSVALTDARVMADISRAMNAGASGNPSARAQRLMRPYY
ncbi:MAG: hypothetical protein ABI907_09760 [Ramlibacter sp.]